MRARRDYFTRELIRYICDMMLRRFRIPLDNILLATKWKCINRRWIERSRRLWVRWKSLKIWRGSSYDVVIPLKTPIWESALRSVGGRERLTKLSRRHSSNGLWMLNNFVWMHRFFTSYSIMSKLWENVSIKIKGWVKVFRQKVASLYRPFFFFVDNISSIFVCCWRLSVSGMDERSMKLISSIVHAIRKAPRLLLCRKIKYSQFSSPSTPDFSSSHPLLPWLLLFDREKSSEIWCGRQ